MEPTEVSRLHECLMRDDSATAPDAPETVALRQQAVSHGVIGETGRSGDLDQSRPDVDVAAGDVGRERDVFEDAFAVQHQWHGSYLEQRGMRVGVAASVMIAGHGEQRAGKPLLDAADELAQALVGVPEVAELDQLLSVIGVDLVFEFLGDLRQGKPFGLQVDVKGRMVA